jgi:murein L,D-transpeptidase YcbB/YkuD
MTSRHSARLTICAAVLATLTCVDPTTAQDGATVAPATANASEQAPAPASGADAVIPKVDPFGARVAEKARASAGRGTAQADLNGLIAYYTDNPGSPLWLQGNAVAPRARAVAAEIAKAGDWGLERKDFALPRLDAPLSDEAARAEFEARMSLAVLKYARHARGGRLNPLELAPDLDRQPPLMDPRHVLVGIAAAPAAAAYLRKLHPQHAEFERLRKLYIALRDGTFIDKSEPQTAPAAEEPETRRGRKRAARAAAPPPREQLTAERVFMNMEQWRWMPTHLGKLYVTVNIPEFTLRVVKNGQTIHSERVIVGQADKQTPILSKDMQSIVFHPGWGVPNSIKVKELLPGLLQGRDSISRQGLVARYRGRDVDPMSIDWRRVDIRNLDIVQPAGPRNVLGLVKFQFPNKHDVYMHDTPTKHLFNASARAFSHGCMRVRNPIRLAEIVMAESAGWSPQQVASTLRNGPMENKVMLERKVPVHITYFTVTTDAAGGHREFRDIYDHEKKIRLGLDGKAHLIPRKKVDLNVARNELINRAPPPGYAYNDGWGWPFGGGPSYGSGNQGFGTSSRGGARGGDWTRSVFGGF